MKELFCNDVFIAATIMFAMAILTAIYYPKIRELEKEYDEIMKRDKESDK